MKSSSFFTSGWARATAGLVVAFSVVASLGLSFLSQPDIARAATNLITNGSFGSGNDQPDIPNWNEEGTDDDGDPSTYAREGQAGGEDSSSPDGGRFAKIAWDSDPGNGKDEWICQKVDAGGYENLVLNYYWRGDNDAEDNEDFGYVEYRATSDGSTDNTCNSNESSWTQLASHELDNNPAGGEEWSSLQGLNLPAELNNDNSWFIRFRAHATTEAEHFRVDGIALEGDEIKTTIQIKKLIDLDGNIQTTDDQTPASGWSFTIDESGPYVTDETGMTVAVEVEDNENYDIAEILQDNHQLLSASCVGADNNGQFKKGKIEKVKLKIGEEAVCTFINAPDRGSISISKVLVNNEEGTLEADDFTLEISDGDAFSETGNGSVTAEELIPGTYYVSEESEVGYEQTSIECSVGEVSVPVGQDGSLTVGAGQDIECEITNTFAPVENDQCSVVIYSDTSNTVVEKGGAFAQALSFIHSAWTATIGGATWIWGDNPVAAPVNGVVQTFEKTFEWNGPVTSATLSIAADNSYVATLNGSPAGLDGGEFNYTLAGQDTYNVAGLIQTGVNEISVAVTNKPGSTDPAANPAGLLYKLEITGTDPACDVAPEEPSQCVAELEGGWADTVVESDQGLKKGGAAVAANRSVTSDVLDEADWTTGGSTGFFSLGFGGTITVSFDSFVPNVEGNDISIHEATNGVYPQESALIEVSQDGSTWYALGTSASNGAVTYFDFDATGLAWIKYVRITDTTNPALHNNDADGFDLDAVDATQTVCDEPIVAQCVPGQELLVNGDFETPTVTNSAKWDIFPSGTSGLGWVVEWFGGALTYTSQNRPAVANLELQKHTLNGWNAVGNAGQWAEVDSDWVGPSGSLNGEPGSTAISQQVLTEIGETYTFSFDFSPRPNTASGQNKVEVLVNNVVIGMVGPTAGVSNTAWTSHEFSFVADSILSTVTLRDAGTPNDSLGAFVDNASLMCTPPEQPKFASVTLCKVNEQEQGLPGWTLLLEKGDAVDSFSVPSTSSAGTDSAPLTAGTPYVALVSGTWNNQGGANIVDAEYSTIDGWATQMDGYTGYQDDILELQIAQTSGAWGAYNSLHSYAQAFTPGASGPVNFRIFDGTGSTPNEGWYGDNSGSLNVAITEGYAGITGNNGCVTFTGVPYGTYDISEMLQDGWVADSENPSTAVVDSSEETFTFVNAPIEIPEETATLHATKIVCEAEEYLPNWGNGIDGPSSITATTATDWLAEGENAEHCWLAPDWEFQWVTNADSSSNPGDNSGEAASPWTTIGPTNAQGVVTAQIPANDQIWVREVLQDGYVSFSGQNTYLHNSAELYCTSDVLNYDNWDFISPVVTDATYYCVAFNAELPPTCAEDETLVNNICVPDDNEGETYSDLEVTKTVDETNVEIGDFVTYTITVTNDGQEAGNVVITENLPAGLSYASHSASNGDENFNPGTLTWTISSLLSGPATLTLVVQVQSGTEGEELENSVTVTSDSNEENTENNEDSVVIFVDDEDEGGGGGGGGDPEPQFFGANGPISGLGGGPLGQVLGASTEGQVLGESCGLYLDKFIRFNRNNDAEQVTKLQQFLNKWLGLSLPLTGFYGPLTYEAVLQFRTQYAETILTPWGLTSPTGIVYLTTLRQINMLECPVLSLELPPLTPWTN